MAILAVACMALGAIEATVSQRNNFNHFNNSSLANQMAYVEKYNNLASVAVYYGGGTKPTKDSHVSSDKSLLISMILTITALLPGFRFKSWIRTKI